MMKYVSKDLLCRLEVVYLKLSPDCTLIQLCRHYVILVGHASDVITWSQTMNIVQQQSNNTMLSACMCVHCACMGMFVADMMLPLCCWHESCL